VWVAQEGLEATTVAAEGRTDLAAPMDRVVRAGLEVKAAEAALVQVADPAVLQVDLAPAASVAALERIRAAPEVSST